MLKITLQSSTENLPIGCAILDRNLGGLPKGAVTLLYGEAGTGKTTLALQAAYSAAINGYKTLFIDADNSFYPERLAYLARGDSEAICLIFVSKPDSFLGLTHLLANLGSYISPEVALVVVDTMTSLYRKTLNGHQNVFSLNREMNLQLAYLNEIAKISKLAVLITSQVRNIFEKVDIMSQIEPVATRAIKFWAQRIYRVSSLPEIGLKELYVEKAEKPYLIGRKVILKLGKEGFSE